MSSSQLSKAEIKELVGTLRAFPRFAEMGNADLETLAKTATLSTVPASWPLINADTPADSCYVILDGEVEVVVDHKPVAQLGAGSVVGEVGLFESRLRNATVVSKTRVKVLHLVAEVFRDLVSAHPAIGAALQGPTLADTAG